MAIEKELKQVEVLMEYLKILPSEVFRAAGELAIAKKKPDVALEFLEMSKIPLKEIAKLFSGADPKKIEDPKKSESPKKSEDPKKIAAILPWLHSKLKKDSQGMEISERIELSNLMIHWFIECEKPELGSLFRLIF